VPAPAACEPCHAGDSARGTGQTAALGVHQQRRHVRIGLRSGARIKDCARWVKDATCDTMKWFTLKSSDRRFMGRSYEEEGCRLTATASSHAPPRLLHAAVRPLHASSHVRDNVACEDA
jgi:hypothetical protein